MNTLPTTNVVNLSVLPENLRWLRQMQKLTLREAAERSGLSISFLSDMERGRTQPSLKTLQKLVSVYKAPISIHIGLQQLPISAPWGEPLDYDVDYEAIKDELERNQTTYQK